MTGWVADLSRAWPALTGRILRSLGADGAIGYAGCDDTSKNVSRERFDDWGNVGLWRALVIENGAEDLKGGASVGARQGKALYNAAGSLGYDRDNCVLFASADWDSRGRDLDAIDAAMGAFNDYVPVPGLYGNSYALDRTHASGNVDKFWQSESVSFSNGISQVANMLQIYNDGRAHGFALDVNNILIQPLGFMGEPHTIQPEDDDMKAYLAAQPTNPVQYWLIAYDFSHKVPITQGVYEGLQATGNYNGFPGGSGMDQTTLVKIPTLDATAQ